jgi:hypothetical protein
MMVENCWIDGGIFIWISRHRRHLDPGWFTFSVGPTFLVQQAKVVVSRLYQKLGARKLYVNFSTKHSIE